MASTDTTKATATAELIAAVREHAAANYHVGGWDSITEAWTDEEIAAEIKGARTVGGAIKKMVPAVTVFAQRRDAAIMTADDAPTAKAPRKAKAAKVPSGAKATKAAPVVDGSGDTQQCNTCDLVKPITAFPTTGRNKEGVMGRGKKCRACRDAK